MLTRESISVCLIDSRDSPACMFEKNRAKNENLSRSKLFALAMLEPVHRRGFRHSKKCALSSRALASLWRPRGRRPGEERRDAEQRGEPELTARQSRASLTSFADCCCIFDDLSQTGGGADRARVGAEGTPEGKPAGEPEGLR